MTFISVLYLFDRFDGNATLKYGQVFLVFLVLHKQFLHSFFTPLGYKVDIGGVCFVIYIYRFSSQILMICTLVHLVRIQTFFRDFFDYI